MQDTVEPATGRGGDTADIAFVLLVLQSAFGFVSALGLIAFARFGAAGAGAGPAILISVGVPLAVLGLAAGVAGRHRWARIGTLIFEGLVLAGSLLRLVAGRGSTLNLVTLLVTLVIPLTVGGLLLTHGVRGASGRRPLTDDEAGTAPRTLHPAA